MTNMKLVQKVSKLNEEFGEQEVLQAISYLGERSIWDNMNAKQREKFFMDECKKLNLTVIEGANKQCLHIKEFKESRLPGKVSPYFIFWRERNSDNDKAGIEFGHYHMTKKLEKDFPSTEYCFGGPREQTKMMQKYVNEIGE